MIFNSHNLTVKINDNGFYLIDLKLKESMHLYYALKERFEYTLENREEAIELIAKAIESFTNEYTHIIVPESSSDFLQKILNHLKKEYTVIPKNNIKDVIAFSETLPLQKKERIAHMERLETMPDVFKINLM